MSSRGRSENSGQETHGARGAAVPDAATEHWAAWMSALKVAAPIGAAVTSSMEPQLYFPSFVAIA